MEGPNQCTLSYMDITQIIAELRSEREQIDEAIVALERLARGSGKRRGRPPKWMTADKNEAPQPARVRVLSAEARKRMAEAQKRRWAAARKAQKQEDAS
jgi:hypothetical protein